MERLQAFNYALQPSGEQARRMRRFAGSCRFVFNQALDIQQKSHEAGGKKVSQKSGLNRAILDQSWGEFRCQLDDKLAWCGGRLIAVAPHNTSRTCPACEHVSGDNRQTQAKFSCVECGYENNADVVGAINVLERGQRLLACGEMGAVRPFCEAGTRRSEPGASLDAVGIPFLPALKSGSPSARGGEDVNVTVFNDGATWIESIIASVSENIQDGKHPKNRTSVQFFG
jgi:predicted RNA-binding Zn-ribbon protein involved in translation (DUF1610 family)